MNSNGNGAKTAVGAVCEEAAGECTLRAAIEASNADSGRSEILFSGGPFNGLAETAINLEGQVLQAISTPMVFLGTTCNPGAGAPTPCVRLENPGSGQPVLGFSSTETEVIDLAIIGGRPASRSTATKSLSPTWNLRLLDEHRDRDRNQWRRRRVPGQHDLRAEPQLRHSVRDQGRFEPPLRQPIENSGLSAIILALGADKNRIGLDTPESENVIENSEQSPIFLQSSLAAESHNEIARNRGSGNGGAFILLQSPANGGIPQPTIATAHPTTVSGTAKPGAKVRLFATAEGTYEVDGFLAERSPTPAANGR